MDQNSEKRDFSLADAGGPAISVDMDLEQTDDESHGFVDHSQGLSTQPPTTQAINLGASGETINSEKMDIFSSSRTGAHGAEQTVQTTRPKRILKPSAKLIENKLQADTLKLEKLWESTVKAISRLQGTSDSIEALRKAVGDVRSIFSEYQLVWVSLMDYTVHASSAEHQEERQSAEQMMKTRKELVQMAINEGIDRKNDLLKELGSNRSGSHASGSSQSSNAIRAQARGEAAAALKKVEMQKKIHQFQTRSALNLESEDKKRREDELAFVRKKREQEAKLEALRVELEAAVAIARVKAIDEELGFGHEHQPLELPTEDPSQRVREFINGQLDEPKIQEYPHDPGLDALNFTSTALPIKKEKELDPRAAPFSSMQAAQTSKPAEKLESVIQFMARRELISNKIEKFDNHPENYHTWKAAFKNMTRDVNITPSEELALMIEYTKGDSNKLVQRLRNAYIVDPAEGLAESWKKIGRAFRIRRSDYPSALGQTNKVPKVGREGQQGTTRSRGSTARATMCQT